MSRPSHVPALVAVKDVGNVGLLDLCARQVHPYAALVALDHWPSCEWLPTVTGDQVPRVVACVDKKAELEDMIAYKKVNLCTELDKKVTRN